MQWCNLPCWLWVVFTCGVSQVSHVIDCKIESAADDAFPDASPTTSLTQPCWNLKIWVITCLQLNQNMVQHYANIGLSQLTHTLNLDSSLTLTPYQITNPVAHNWATTSELVCASTLLCVAATVKVFHGCKLLFALFQSQGMLKSWCAIVMCWSSPQFDQVAVMLVFGVSGRTIWKNCREDHFTVMINIQLSTSMCVTLMG